MSNYTPKNSPKEISETIVHISTHEVCKYFQAQSNISYSVEVKYRSEEVEEFMPALASWGLSHALNDYITSRIHSLPPTRGQT